MLHRPDFHFEGKSKMISVNQKTLTSKIDGIISILHMKSMDINHICASPFYGASPSSSNQVPLKRPDLQKFYASTLTAAESVWIIQGLTWDQVHGGTLRQSTSPRHPVISPQFDRHIFRGPNTSTGLVF